MIKWVRDTSYTNLKKQSDPAFEDKDHQNRMMFFASMDDNKELYYPQFEAAPLDENHGFEEKNNVIFLQAIHNSQNDDLFMIVTDSEFTQLYNQVYQQNEEVIYRKLFFVKRQNDNYFLKLEEYNF